MFFPKKKTETAAVRYFLLKDISFNSILHSQRRLYTFKKQMLKSI